MYLAFCLKLSQVYPKLVLSFGRLLFSLLFTFLIFSRELHIVSHAPPPTMRK
nr:MAG TPA: hypothetical protein [Caudoviricetes sp.]